MAIGEAGETRITFYPAAVDLCHEEFEQVGDGIPVEAEKPPNAPGTRVGRIRGVAGGEGGRRAAMAVAVAVAAPSWSVWGSGRGRFDRVTRGGVVAEGGRRAAGTSAESGVRSIPYLYKSAGLQSRPLEKVERGR